MSVNIDQFVDKVLNKSDEETDWTQVLDEEFVTLASPPDLAFANVARRRLIEGRLAPLRIEDMYLHGECRQKVEIIPKKLTVTYRTPTGAETLYVRRKLGEARSEVNVYVNTYHSLLEMCSYIQNYNGTEFPALSDGQVSEEAFKARLDKLSQLPQIVLEDLWINQKWFIARVRAAATADNLKGG
jgi:hypothetical protein